MSIQLPTIDLSAATVGLTGTVTFQNANPTASLNQYKNPAHIQIYNESGCGLNITFLSGGNTTFIPAGGWVTFTLGVGESGYSYQVAYILTNPNVSSLVTLYYLPGEQVPDIAALGNSPIGGGTLTANSSQLNNTGNVPGSNIITVKPNDSTSNTWTADNSGNLLISSDNAGVIVNLLQLIAGAGPEVIIAAATVITQVLGDLDVSGNFLVQGSNGVTSTSGSFYGTDASHTILQSSGSTGSGNTRLQNTDHLSLQVPGGSEQIGINSSTITLGSTNVSVTGTMSLSHSLNLVVGSIGQLSKFSGTGNGSIATGITNPTSIAFDPCTVSGSSQTIGGTVASTSVVTTGSGLAWQATAWHA